MTSAECPPYGIPVDFLCEERHPDPDPNPDEIMIPWSEYCTSEESPLAPYLEYTKSSIPATCPETNFQPNLETFITQEFTEAEKSTVSFHELSLAAESSSEEFYIKCENPKKKSKAKRNQVNTSSKRIKKGTTSQMTRKESRVSKKPKASVKNSKKCGKNAADKPS